MDPIKGQIQPRKNAGPATALKIFLAVTACGAGIGAFLLLSGPRGKDVTLGQAPEPAALSEAPEPPPNISRAEANAQPQTEPVARKQPSGIRAEEVALP